MQVSTTRDSFTAELFAELQAMEMAGFCNNKWCEKAADYILRNPETFNQSNVMGVVAQYLVSQPAVGQPMNVERIL
jgi:hypothetical protein